MSGFGLLGERLGHSFSPKIHSLLGDYAYELCEVPPEGLAEFLLCTEMQGMNVTIPYKKAVIPFCKALSPAAEAIGSVNTLVRRDGGWYGDNTDAFGFGYLLRRRGIDPAGKRCAVLGSGGASVTVQYVLRRLGAASVAVLSRGGRNDYAHLGDYAETQLLVNATPVGMFPGNGVSPVPAEAFPVCEAAVDLIYNPLRSAFLQELQQQTSPGLQRICENGLAMLVAQAAASAALFTGETSPEGKIEEILCKLESETENIALIGMPGCGKTTVGRVLAELMGRPFADLDAEITRKTGKTPETWLNSAGEAEFRQVETRILRELSKSTGMVLACGGGVVSRRENLALLRQNSRVVWINRELCKLSTEGRPLSQQESPEGLYAQRRPLYEAFADCAAENGGSPAETAKKILEALK